MEDIGGGKCGAKNENRKEGKCLEKGKYFFGKEEKEKNLNYFCQPKIQRKIESKILKFRFSHKLIIGTARFLDTVFCMPNGTKDQSKWGGFSFAKCYALTRSSTK